MYGVPADLDLSFFNGAELTQVCLGLFDVQFRFEPAIVITAFDGWILYDQHGTSIDQGDRPTPRPPFQLHRLLGQHVVGTVIDAPEYLELLFEHGERLRLIDNSEQYESFNIEPFPRSNMIIV